MTDVEQLDTNRVLYRCPKCEYEEWKTGTAVPGITIQLNNDWYPMLKGVCPGCIYNFLQKMFPLMQPVVTAEESAAVPKQDAKPGLVIGPFPRVME